jgi:hypothetical protein
MTIRNYFLNDFVAISFDNPLQLQITNENNEIQTVSFDEKVVNQNDGSTRFFVYFIPRSNLTALVCKEMILNYKNSIERAEQIETIPGRQGDLNIGKHRSIYSKRIYFYTESDISSSDLLILEKIAGENDLYLTFRNSKYLKTKMDIEKPQAFISHDSRDKEEIARKLAYGLSSRLCTVWYDEYSLKIGDSLRDSIEKGIKEAKKCILVLTPNFLNNLGWTKKEFIKQKKYSDSNFSKLINIICELSLQQYNQFIHQSIIIYNLLDKIITFYSQVSPKSLVKFIWEIDQKDIKETKYEKVFKDVFIGIIEVLTKDKPLQIVNFKKSDYSYFFENFQIMDNTKMKELNKETKEIYKRDFGENEQYLRGIDLHKLLLNNLMLKDSKDSFGIQIADLLVSSVNRCLKRNFSDNEKMAKILGRLMINSYVENQKAILISTISEQNICVNRIDDITNIMDRESIKVYKFTTEIYSKKI